MWEFDTEFSEVIQRTPDVKSFRFPVSSRNADFVPGQFFFVTIKVKGEDALHHFSFSSSPTDEQHIEFTKRITAHDFSQALNAIKPGEKAHIRGPLGVFTLPVKSQPLCFISGGIGITPLRSMLRYIVAKKLEHDVVLLYGNNNFEDIVFRDELEHLQSAQSNIRIVFFLAGAGVPPGWKGRTGLINQDAIRELVPDHKQRVFYLSGPPKMVTALTDMVTPLGVPVENVKQDSFTGYD